LVASITDCLKKNSHFVRTDEVGKAFALIKEKMTNVHILAFLNFEKVFELECDACEVGIRAVLSQEKRPIVFLNEKLMRHDKNSLHMSRNCLRCTVL